MQLEDLKTLGAVETVLGLLEVALGSLPLQVKTFFKKEIFVVFISGVWTALTGLSLLCGGRKPSYSCTRFNVTFHLATVIFSAVAFGTIVRHVPYQQKRYCNNYSCDSVAHETMLLVGGILAVLLTVLLVETFVSLAVVLTGLCSMLTDHPQQPEVTEVTGSITSEPLCPAPTQQVTPGGEIMKTDS